MKDKTLALVELNKNDIVITPAEIVDEILSYLDIKGFVLDPCAGEFAFYKKLPEPKDWCEIQKGKDFFDWEKKVDWIVSNPPYSNFNEFLDHSFDLSENVCFLVPFAKVFKSWGVIKRIKEYGGIVKIWIAPASICGFPFGFPVGAFHFKKNYSGLTELIYSKHTGKTRFKTDIEKKRRLI